MPSLDEEKVDNDDPNPLGLDEGELTYLSSQVELPASTAGYGAIYRYADRLDLLVMFLSGVVAFAAGATMPLMTIILGSLVGQFSSLADTSHLALFSSKVNHMCLYFVYVGVGSLVCHSLFVAGFTWTGQRISQRMRAAYLEALLRQNVAFLDSLSTGEITTQITADMNAVQEGISQKVGLILQSLATFVTAITIAFVRSWRLALVMLSLPISVTVFMAMVGLRMKNAQGGALTLFSSAASFAEEAISSMRNVAAYGSQRRFAKRYDASLIPAMQADFKAKVLLSILIGGLTSMMLTSFALACWAGHLFLDAGDVTTSQVITVQFSMMIGAVIFANLAPHLQALGSAGAAANRIFAATERKPTVSLDVPGSIQPDRIQGHIEFRDIKLVYPARRNQLVLDGFSLDVPAGKTTAIVGPSGSGKSSLFYLVQLFYLPLRGQLLIDGHDVKDLNLRWLRSKMRMVSQESFLFDTTVFENIAFGLIGTEHENADQETKKKLVEDAAKAANAHDFIMHLPLGYQARVGEVGGLLSGGQRQRIAIARAVVCSPQILLLDEATAALDTKSESKLQTALELSGGPTGRTTIVIAHRLSTVRHADKIVVMEHGVITEQGTHEQLLAKGGTYASLAADQDLQNDIAESDGKGNDPRDEKEVDATTLLRGQSAKASAREQAQQQDKGSRMGSIGFLWNLNKPERGIMVIGLVGSAFTGLAYPLTAIFFGNMILGFTQPDKTLGGHGVGFWAGMQLLLACVMLFSFLAQNLSFAYASSRLVSRARSVAFAAILRQDMEFLTKPDNSSGALTAFLSVQANRLNGLSGAILGAVLSSIFAVAAGFVVAVSFGWKLGLVSASLMPVIFSAGYARYRILMNMEAKNMRDTEAASIVSEAMRGIRTVAAIGLEDIVAARYRTQLGDEVRQGVAKDFLMAFLYGTSQSIIVFGSALIFWYGGSRLLPSGGYTVQNFLTCYVATTYAAQSAGGIFSHAPDLAGAQEAVNQLRRLLATIPRIDVDSDAGDSADGVAGDVELRGIDFAYPSEEGKAQLVLSQVSLRADSGRFIALVGASGSGKSSVLNLLERLYDPRAGCVLADGRDIRQFNLQGYRRQLAIVEQDAVLYSGSIKENVIGDKEVDEKDIERACRDANIWEFVESLPDGVNTHVGPRGSQVSGGQKQRLALARALLRNPKVLLLDEATSALDSRSEAAVQQALAAAAAGRTTIAVAHRLSSIAHADCIYVFDNGSIVEQGTHAELMAKHGRYWEYVGMQNLGS